LFLRHVKTFVDMQWNADTYFLWTAIIKKIQNKIFINAYSYDNGYILPVNWIYLIKMSSYSQGKCSSFTLLQWWFTKSSQRYGEKNSGCYYIPQRPGWSQRQRGIPEYYY